MGMQRIWINWCNRMYSGVIVLDTSRKVNGVSTSLADIGYNRIGVDDNC